MRDDHRTIAVLALLWVCGGGCLSLTPHEGPDQAAGIRYRLRQDGFVTVVIEDAQGRRVRNLLAYAPRSAGEHVEAWDGMDDEGRPAAAGTYRWRGLVHGEITSHFAGVIYSPGDPPWVTSEVAAQWYVRPSGRGGWLSDHGAPLRVFAAGERIFLGAAVAEAGHSVMELDPDGRKRWGTLWLGQAGANALAADGGILYVAGEGGWLGKWLAINRVDLRTYRYVPNPPDVQKQRTDICFVKEKQEDFSGIRGLAVAERYLVLSLTDRGRLALFDRESAAFVRNIPLERPGGLVTVAGQEILAVSGGRIVRVNLETGAASPVVVEQLIEPFGLAVDPAGAVYVSDVAPAEQCVKVFAADGTFQRRIGRPGGRHEGAFDPQAVANPTGIGVDGRGRVWVAENDYLPKRISVWSTDGDFVRDFIGPPLYGGGAALDPRVPGRAYHKGMVFDWQPWPQPGRLRAVSFHPEAHPDLPIDLSHDRVPQFPAYHGGRCYLVHDNGWASGGMFIGELRDDVLRPAVIFGDLASLRKRWQERYPEFVASLPAGNAGTFLWLDADSDGRAIPDEVAIQPGWRVGSEWGFRAYPTLTLCARDGSTIKLLSPLARKDKLVYDPSAAATVPLPAAKGIVSMIVDPDGNPILNFGGTGVRGDKTNKLAGLDPQGRVRWTYPNPYPTNTHSSPRPGVGDILHTLDVEGFADAGAKTGQIFQLAGNKGCRYLFTADGLFVAETFPDIRLAPGLHSVRQVERGQALQGHNLGDEVFGGWFGRAGDGKIYQILGKEHCSIFEVHGLETIRRLSGGTFSITAAAPAVAAGGSAPAEPVSVLLGGIPHDWRERQAYAFSAGSPLAWFSMAAADNGLSLAIEVKDDSPFANHGQDPAELCRSGDAIDFRLATRPGAPSGRTDAAVGDLRFIATMLQDRPVVVRYRYVVPGTTAPREFVSPTGRVTVDAIDILPDDQARIHVERQEGGYRLRMTLAWAALNLDGRPQGTLRGDVGVIFSDPSGQRAVEREYYFDTGSREVSDLPSEIRIRPAQWGPIRF
ncbi:MAG TPA: FlgD immunoglobulin-like domain containing protein [Planctomycetota bacterium]|nr:FlgD immunoglobulin-like domain containing protein [Planctomycetota bacterium]